MALQNRVTPRGEIIETPARGTIMGNRGILHDDDRRIVRTSRNTMWLICRLEFKGRRRPLMSPGTYTELFFLDEAVALAAGHRPCGECRRMQYRAFIEAVNDGVETRLDGPRDLDRRLNESRRAPRTKDRLADLPNGVFVSLDDDDFWLVWDGSLHRWSPGGYLDDVAIDDAGVETVAVVTPQLTVAALRHGYSPEVHRSARPATAPPPTCSGYSEPAPETSQSPTRDATEQPMSTLSTELRDEIKRHLRVNPVRHGEVFRAMEQGLDVDQMGTSRANAQSFLNSVEAMLAGILPTTQSAAMRNSYGYRYLLGCKLSPELLSHTKSFLRRLESINPEVRVDEPLHIRSLPGTKPQRRSATTTLDAPCPRCHLVHAGECD